MAEAAGYLRPSLGELSLENQLAASADRRSDRSSGMSFAIALGASMVLTWAARWWLRSTNRLDHPTSRSLHAVPTPRGGGIGPVVALIAALSLWRGLETRETVAILAAVVPLAALGFVDDLRSPPATARLAVQVVVSGCAIAVLGVHPLAAALLAGLWVVSFTNAFNFMDGVDGIAAVQVVVAGCVWAAVGWRLGNGALQHASVVLLLVAVGFLPFNFPRATVFLGDVGSYGLGSALALLVLVGRRHGAPLLAIAAPLSVFAADTFATLLRRLLRGEQVLHAHREHTFQRLVERGWSHVSVTLAVGALSAAAGLAGLLGTAGTGWSWAGAAGVALICLAYLALPSTLGRR